ncbi:MAG: response regulator [Armatimonadetes bacterium]|nr:response regulator [Armatimonadota bacterium]
MSVRQLRREQQAALEALTLQLQERFNVSFDGTTDPPANEETAETALRVEVPWLMGMPPETPAELERVLANVIEVARPLAAKHGVEIDVRLSGCLPPVAVDPVVLRQILLSLLGAAIPWSSSTGQINIEAKTLQWEVETVVSCICLARQAGTLLPDEHLKVAMARELAEASGGKLSVTSSDSSLRAALLLPALEQLPVLAIDDNEGTLRLLQRYTTGTRYRLIGVRHPEDALDVATRLLPQIIVVDVMMPRVDGWEVLGRLREHPQLGSVPIIVCSILAQEELSLTLGASGFVQKPVSRRDFLAALDHAIQLKGTICP